MATTIADYMDVKQRLHELGCNDPEGLMLLPVNFDTADSVKEFRQVEEAATVKTLIKSANLPYTDILPAGKRPPYVINRSLDWVAPTLLVSASVIADSGNTLAIILEHIANYVTAFLHGIGQKKSVKLDIVVERKNKNGYRKISYEGPPEGLKDIVEVVEAATNE